MGQFFPVIQVNWVYMPMKKMSRVTKRRFTEGNWGGSQRPASRLISVILSRSRLSSQGPQVWPEKVISLACRKLDRAEVAREALYLFPSALQTLPFPHSVAMIYVRKETLI